MSSFKDEIDADNLINILIQKGYPAYKSSATIKDLGIWYRVRIGEYKTNKDALKILDKLIKEEKVKPFIINY